MKYVLLILIFISGLALSEEVCIDKDDLYIHTIYHELLGEGQSSILSKIELTEFGLRVVDKFDERYENNQTHYIDQVQELYFSSIISTVNFLESKGIEFSMYERRIKSALDMIQSKSQYYPITTSSEEYHKLKKLVESRLITNKDSATR
jgi:hypothetical protein